MGVAVSGRGALWPADIGIFPLRCLRVDSVSKGESSSHSESFCAFVFMLPARILRSHQPNNLFLEKKMREGGCGCMRPRCRMVRGHRHLPFALIPNRFTNVNSCSALCSRVYSGIGPCYVARTMSLFNGSDCTLSIP